MVIYAIYKNCNNKLGREELKLPEVNVVKSTTPEIHPINSLPKTDGDEDQNKDDESSKSEEKESTTTDHDDKSMDASNQV